MQDHSASDGLEVTIDGPHRGHVRCARLTVREGASLVGDVRADFVKVLGRLDGNVQANVLAVGPKARLMRGSATLRETPIIAPGATIKNFSMFVGFPAEALEAGFPVPASAGDVRPAAPAEEPAYAPEVPAGFGGPDPAEPDGADADGGAVVVVAGASGLTEAMEAAIREEIALLRREVEGGAAIADLSSVEEAAAITVAASPEPVAGTAEPEAEAEVEDERETLAISALEAEIAAAMANEPVPVAAVAAPARTVRTIVLPSLV